MFDVQRNDLLAGICTLVRPYGYVDLANDVLLQILLDGDKDFPNNHIVLVALNKVSRPDPP